MLEIERAARHDGFSTPKVTPAAFLGTIWALTTLSFLFLPARFYARWTTLRRFYSDDLFVVLAWIVSLGITSAVTAFSNITFEVMDLSKGHRKFPPNVSTITVQFTRVFNIVPMLLYVGLWSVKISFLLFFRTLGVRALPGLRRWWWTVLGICLLTFGLCYTTLPYRCCFTTFQRIISSECQTQGWSFISMKVNCALDVFTDCLIITIPYFLLRKVRTSLHQKFCLSIVFSFVIVTIIFAIVRATVTTTGVKRQIDPIWMYMWSSIELNVAIIVACIAPYRSLFLRPRTSNSQAHPLGGAAKFRDQSSSNTTPFSPWVSYGALWRGTGERTAVNQGQERPALGVLPDESGNWSTVGASTKAQKDGGDAETNVFEMSNLQTGSTRENEVRDAA